MKKVVLFALLLATVAAASAQAVDYQPKWGIPYYCIYYNYSGPASNPGYSTWHNPVYYNPGGTLLIRAQETFTTSYGGDTFNVSWAKPVPAANGGTDWEFTFNPSGPQCKKTNVNRYRSTIQFEDCTDGHTRTCYSTN